jgi:hypothetical protein
VSTRWDQRQPERYIEPTRIERVVLGVAAFIIRRKESGDRIMGFVRIRRS